jgi:hypothetical protein
MDNYMKFSEILKKQAKFDIYDYKTMVPESCIIRELHDRFIYRVKYLMVCQEIKPSCHDVNAESDKSHAPKWDIRYEGGPESVFFPREGIDPNEIFDEELREQSEVFGERITDRNMDEICKKLI